MRDRRKQSAKTLQREATRARLLKAARRLFGKYGYHDVAITEISREAGVTHGVIHSHFHSKAGLLFAILSQNNEAQLSASQSVAESEGPILSRLRKVIEIWAGDDLRDRELLKVMQAFSWEWPYDFEEQNRIQLVGAMEPLRILIREAQHSGELRAGLDIERVVAVAFAIYTQTLRQIVFDDETIETCVEEIMARLELFADGLRPAASQELALHGAQS